MCTNSNRIALIKPFYLKVLQIFQLWNFVSVFHSIHSSKLHLDMLYNIYWIQRIYPFLWSLFRYIIFKKTLHKFCFIHDNSLCDNCEKTCKLNLYVYMKCVNRFNINASVMNAFPKRLKNIVNQISAVYHPLD